MIELPFDTEEIADLVLRLKSIMAREGVDIPEPGGNASDDEVAEMLQETSGDLSRDEVTQEIESMNDEQQDALVTLFWIGRGDVEPESWLETMALARQRHSGPVSQYLLAKPLVATYLADGMEAMENSGLLDA